jgi:hypothetical protein
MLLITRPQFVVLVLPASVLIAFALALRNHSRALSMATISVGIPAIAFSVWRLLSLVGNKGYAFI